VNVKKFALVIDLFFVLLFVAIGRSSHHHGEAVGGILSTAWPFITGLLLGWYIVTRKSSNTLGLAFGEFLVVVTVAVGMVLRVLSGQGTDVAFTIVAFLFLNLMLLGWRLLCKSLKHRLSRGPASK
jgi:hypothetical protein